MTKGLSGVLGRLDTEADFPDFETVDEKTSDPSYPISDILFSSSQAYVSNIETEYIEPDLNFGAQTNPAEVVVTIRIPSIDINTRAIKRLMDGPFNKSYALTLATGSLVNISEHEKEYERGYKEGYQKGADFALPD